MLTKNNEIVFKNIKNDNTSDKTLNNQHVD